MIRLPAEFVEALRPAFVGRRVLVTGGTGFIGSHCVDALLALGATVTVIDDLSSSDAAHVASLIDLEPDRVRFVHGSILDTAALRDAAEGAAIVLHLAAIGSVPRSIDEPERSFAVNAGGTVRVMEAARRFGARRVVLAASSSAYGGLGPLPSREDGPTAPKSPYAASKLAAEECCRAWSASYGLSTCCLRYFNVFGPRQRAGGPYAAVIPAFIDACLSGRRPVIHGDGGQTRDLTYVSNAVLATLQAAASERELAGEAVNVAAGQTVTIGALALDIASACGRDGLQPEHAPPRAGDVRDSAADLGRARELLGYRPVCDLGQGLRETVAWARAERGGPAGADEPQDAPSGRGER